MGSNTRFATFPNLADNLKSFNFAVEKKGALTIFAPDCYKRGRREEWRWAPVCRRHSTAADIKQKLLKTI